MRLTVRAAVPILLIALVIKVVDGDTIVVADRLAPATWQLERVRFASCDAPELTTEEGKKAKAFLGKLLPIGSRVLLFRHTVRDRGPFGRLLRDAMMPDGRWICREMVEAGHARWRRGRGGRRR